MIQTLLLLLLQQTIQIPFIHQPEPQPEKTRTYRYFSFDRVKTIQSDSIYRPGIIRLTNDAIYVLDYSPYARVLKLNSDTGELLAVYGKQRGKGPGDTGNPTNFTFTKNGDVWIADPANARLSVFNRDGKPGTLSDITKKVIFCIFAK